ncbi:MAG: cytochrome c [Woeseiaceae bacterium]
MVGRRWSVVGKAIGLAILSISLFAASFAAEPTKTDREFIEMQTSVNATMVAVVDWAAHEIWEAGYAETMTGRNWLTTKQYAIQLLASGTLVSLGGSGKADMGWVNNPAWQTWSAEMIQETERALVAIDAKDQAALKASGERLVDTCEGCHDAFKPSIPTEAILHVPHHEYGEPLITE